MVTKEMFAAGLAETAWGQIVLWNLAGKIQGTLSYEEFRKPMEARFLEALGRRENDCGSGKERPVAQVATGRGKANAAPAALSG